MIESLFNTTCALLKQGSRDSFGDPERAASDPVPCAFVDRAGLVIKDAQGADVVISGFVYLDAEVEETDRIAIGGYEYEIVSGGISRGDDLIAGTTDHIRVAVARRRPDNETVPEIRDASW